LIKVIEGYTAYGTQGLVVSSNPIASYLGLRVLEETGNIVDAAITTSLVLSVVESYIAGIGGDLAVLVKKNGNIKAYLGVGKSPRKLSLELIYSMGYNSIPDYGPLSILVPGMIDVIRLLHKDYSKTDLKDLVAPAIRIARHGIPADHKLIRYLKEMYTHISRDPQTIRAYMYQGRIPNIGDKIGPEFLAETLEKIAEDPRRFYEGDIAELIVKHVKRKGGVLELEDLASYHAIKTEPLILELNGKIKVYEIPPPSQGVLVQASLLLMSRILEEHRPRLYSKEYVRFVAEVYRKTYSLRDTLLENISKIDSIIDDSVDDVKAKINIPKHGSTGFIIASINGDVIVGTQSLYTPFGSGITVRKTGITLNAGTALFSPAGINKLEPSKHPITTLSSPIIEDREHNFTIGLAGRGGGFKQQYYSQIILKHLFYKQSLSEAIGSPRLRYRSGLIVDVEEGYEDLMQLDTWSYHIHIYAYPSDSLGVINAARVLYSKHIVEAVSDPRDSSGIALI